MTHQRDPQLDGLKYFLICLVVFCHLIQGVRYEYPIIQALYSVVYSFHMPLFVLISGFLFRSTSKEKLRKSNLRIAEPLIIWHFLFVHSLHPLNYLYFEPSPMWYLLSLILWRWMTYLFDKILVYNNIKYEQKNVGIWKRIIYVIVATTLSLGAFCGINNFDGCYLSIMRTFQFYPFFVIGHCMTDKSLNYLREGKGIIPLSILTFVVVVVTCNLAGPKLNAIFFSKYGIVALQKILGIDYMATLLVHVISMIAATILCLFFLSIFRGPKWFLENGCITLFILCTHSMIYFYAQNITNISFAIPIALTTIVFLTILGKTKIAHWFLYPVSSLIKAYNKHD